MSEPIRILHIIAGMGSGGAEMMIMNWYRNINRELVQFDFLLRSDENIYEDETLSLGGRIYTMPEFPRHIIKNHIETDKFFKTHAKDYAAVHIHANALIYVDALKLAKKYGIKHRIMHSHNTKTEITLYTPIHNWNKRRIESLATDFLACSNPAGRWMFCGEYQVINNAIDLKRFAFNEHFREKIRKEHNLGDRFVVGHVGRFLESKNHRFLIEVFEEIKKQKNDAVLCLIGTGVLENQIRELVKFKGLEDSILFLGVKKNIPEYYSAFDVMVFPSLFEGLGIVAVEAQAAGLAVVVSEAVPEEARVTNKISVKSLSENAFIWAETVLKVDAESRPLNVMQELTLAGFNIENEIGKLENLYFDLR